MGQAFTNEFWNVDGGIGSHYFCTKCKKRARFHHFCYDYTNFDNWCRVCEEDTKWERCTRYKADFIRGNKHNMTVF